MEKKTCACCGGEIPAKDTEAVTLSDGAAVCGACCAAVRILCPKSFTWVNVYYSGDTDDDYASDEDAVWLDPLAEIDLAAFRDARARAETERAARRAAWGAGRAYFRVEDNSRIIRDAGKGRKVPTDEYAVSGTVLLGEIQSGGTLSVRRREKTFVRAIKRLEAPGHNGIAMGKTERIAEGCFGRLILDGDAPYIYPGDMLAIE